MIGEIFGNIMELLKRTAPISIVSNMVISIVLLIAGILLLLRKQKTEKKKIGGWVCISISALAFLGSIADWVLAYII